MREEKITTLHPDPEKRGVRIDKAKYDQLRETILELLEMHGEMQYKRMVVAAEEKLAGRFEGSVPWYLISVKLDLEARGIIERVPKVSPQLLRLKAAI